MLGSAVSPQTSQENSEFIVLEEIMSRVDVVIPCYNYAHFLRGCVESVLSQPGVEVRVLIIDDASRDDTPDVAQELRARDPRVEYRRHQTNQGHIATYNEGLLEWASGDYVLLLSADDLLTPGALERAACLLDAHPEMGLVHGPQIMFQTDEALPAVKPVPADNPNNVLPGLTFLENFCAMGHNPVATPTVVVRTRLLHVLGGYRKELPHTADMEMWMRFAIHGEVGYVDAAQAYKRSHGQNMQMEYTVAPLGDLRQRQAAFEILFRDWGARLPERHQLEQLATQSLAKAAFWAGSHAFDHGDAFRCRLLLDYALSLDPALRSGPHWSRLRWKRCLGTKVWSWLRPVVEGFRGRPVGSTHQTTKTS
jgi:glycosyltransferase involved in cell wall biosynthesis